MRPVACPARRRGRSTWRATTNPRGSRSPRERRRRRVRSSGSPERDTRTMDLAIVGAGRVGTSLAVLWQRAGHRIVAVAGGPATPERAARFLPGVPVADAVDAATAAEVVVIATPDAVIAPVCREMSEAGGPGSAAAAAPRRRRAARG